MKFTSRRIISHTNFGMKKENIVKITSRLLVQNIKFIQIDFGKRTSCCLVGVLSCTKDRFGIQCWLSSSGEFEKQTF